MMFCPNCGLKLLLLAKGHGDAHDLTKKRLKYASEEELTFYICGDCKTLLLRDGKSDLYFKVVGRITDESLAMLIADSLKGEDS